MNTEGNTIKVWDPFVRVFHWSLAATFALAWVSAEETPKLHEQAGYFILVLVGLRVLWGLVGTRHARFSDFLASPARTWAYLRAMKAGRPERYLGHNPAGGWMIVALLISLVGATASGLFVDGGSELWEELHEGLANLTLALVLVHLGGVLVATLQHRENLVKAMWTGRKSREASDA